MTAPTPSDHDELVSAYLDGHAAPDEVAIVEADPALLARVEALRGLTRAIATATAPDPVERDHHLQVALGEFDRLSQAGAFPQPAPDLRSVAAAASEPSDRSSAPVSLAEARDRRRHRRFNLVAVAAAVVALLFAGIVAIGLNRGDTHDLVDATSDASLEIADDDASFEVASDGDASSVIASAAADVGAVEADAFDEDEAFAADQDDRPTAGEAEATGARRRPADDGSDEHASSKADEAVDEQEEEGEEEGEEPAAPEPGSAPESAALSPSVDAEAEFADDATEVSRLGPFSTIEELAGYLETTTLATTLAESDPPPSYRPACQTIADDDGRADGTVGPVMHVVATASIGNRSAEILGMESGALAIVETEGCVLLHLIDAQR